MDTVSRRIKHDDVRFFFQLIQHLKYIACYEFAVGNTVSCSVFFCSLDRFFDNLHAYHLLCHRSQHLADGSRSAEEVEHGHVTDVPDIVPHRLIEHFSALGIRLEEGKRRDLEIQTKQFFIEVVLSPEDACLVALHHVGERIIENMQDAHDLSLQFQIQKRRDQRLQIMFLLSGGHQIYQDLTRRVAAPQEQMTEISGVLHFPVVAHISLPEIFQHAHKDLVHILVDKAAV